MINIIHKRMIPLIERRDMLDVEMKDPYHLERDYDLIKYEYKRVIEEIEIYQSLLNEYEQKRHIEEIRNENSNITLPYPVM